MIGRIHSFQSLGTLDGPGIRFVVFFQGCNLRCSCCHNPDTWLLDSSCKKFTEQEIIDKTIRFKEYFGTKGGITASGGEALLQAKFCKELFRLAHENGINTCLDTSGSILNSDVQDLLKYTDRVLLDIKYTSNDEYQKYVGCSLDVVLEFLDYLNSLNIKTTIRQVIIPGINDNEANIHKLNNIIKKYPNCDSVELLPFRKLCQVKYDTLNIPFPFKEIPEATKSKIDELNKLIILNE